MLFRSYNLTVKDTAEKQMFNINILTTRSYAVIAGGSAVILALLALIIALIRRSMRRRKEEARLEAAAAAAAGSSRTAPEGEEAQTGQSDNSADGGGADA